MPVIHPPVSFVRISIPAGRNRIMDLEAGKRLERWLKLPPAIELLGNCTKPRRVRKARVRPPDGLLTKAEAAAQLGCSIKTLDGYVETGALRYGALGHGKKRPRKMFTDADLDQFIAAQTRKDAPCQSTRPVARHTGISTSKCEVIGFTARRNARRAAKPKK